MCSIVEYSHSQQKYMVIGCFFEDFFDGLIIDYKIKDQKREQNSTVVDNLIFEMIFASTTISRIFASSKRHQVQALI